MAQSESFSPEYREYRHLSQAMRLLTRILDAILLGPLLATRPAYLDGQTVLCLFRPLLVPRTASRPLVIHRSPDEFQMMYLDDRFVIHPA